MTVNEIAAKIEADKGNVSRSVSVLTKKRFVIRTPCADDGRKVNLALSAEGRTLFDRINPLARRRESKLLSALTDEERTHLDSITLKLLAQLEKMNAELPP